MIQTNIYQNPREKCGKISNYDKHKFAQLTVNVVCKCREK